MDDTHDQTAQGQDKLGELVPVSGVASGVEDAAKKQALWNKGPRPRSPASRRRWASAGTSGRIERRLWRLR